MVFTLHEVTMANWDYTITTAYQEHYSYLQNAWNVKDYLDSVGGFSAGAIIGIVANMEHESAINPGQQEHGYGGSTSRGYGLVQWTPGTKIINYADSVGGNWYDGDIQMDFLMINAPDSWGGAMPYTWDEFKAIDDIYLATRVFFKNFERGTWHDELYDYAEYWYGVLYGSEPPTPPSPRPGQLQFFMLCGAKARKRKRKKLLTKPFN